MNEDKPKFDYDNLVCPYCLESNVHYPLKKDGIPVCKICGFEFY